MDTVTFPGCFKSLAEISDFVKEAAREAGLDSTAVYQVQLAVDEACCNIIDHAYGGEGLGNIECSVGASGDQLTIILRDQGASFTPEKVPPPKLNVPLQEIKPRGVGLYLMRKLMDEVDYESSPERGNTLKMTKKR